MDIVFLNQVRKFAQKNDEQHILDFAKIVAQKALESDHYKDYIKAAGIFEGIAYSIKVNEPVSKRQIANKFINREYSANRIKNLLENFLKKPDVWQIQKLYFESRYCEADDYWFEKKNYGLNYFWVYCTDGIKQIDKMFNGEGKNYHF